MSLRAVAYLLIVTTVIQAIVPEVINVRSKRQNCRCVRDVNTQGALTCGCANPVLMPGVPLAAAQYQQQLALAAQLQYVQPVYASCGCVPLMFLANPVYSCQCNNVQTTQPPVTTAPGGAETTTITLLPGTLPITTTTPLPTLPPVITTPTTTTTTEASTPPPTFPPTTTTSTTTTTTTTTTPAPTTTTTLPTTTTTQAVVPTTPPCIYPPLATINGTTPGCFCLDVTTQVVRPFCGCQCDCNQGLTSVPTGVCSCPQNTQTVTSVSAMQPDGQDSTYPLTTTCVIKIGASQPSSSCSCLPQYNNCAPNICCLKPNFRSLKKTSADDSSAIDLIIDMLKKMRKNF